VLLAGSATSTYTVGDQTTAGREEAFQFTAASSGTVEEMQFRTNAVANTGVTGVVLGVFADSAGKPGEVLGQATASGEPAVNSWVKATGLRAAVVSGTKYWLVVLPLGEGTKKLHYNVAVATGGAGNVESKAGGLASLTAQASWETYNQGPVGFQALGHVAGAAGAATAGAAAPLHVGITSASLSESSAAATGARLQPSGASASNEPLPRVAIAGAPASMIAGTSIQLSAALADNAPRVSWSASAGSISPGGLYTAPSVAPAGGTVTLLARGARGGEDRRAIAIAPVPPAAPAPTAPLPGAAASTSAASGGGPKLALSSVSSGVSQPEAMLVGHTLVLTAKTLVAGRVGLSASLDGRSLGGCTIPTPAGRSFTCRLALAKSISPSAPIATAASLRVGDRTLRSLRPAAPVARMKMDGIFGATQIVVHGHLVAASQFLCDGTSLAQLHPTILR
jgi:hypothetical protein